MILRGTLAVFFVVAGGNHFLAPDVYLGIMPPGFPWPAAMVWISGVAEVAGGLGVLVPRLRRAAGWGLIALLIAVFPVNIYGALHGMALAGRPVPEWMLWVRLPIQFLFIAWVYAACLRTPGKR